MYRVRLKDVAEAAGVSINTASRALNGKAEISPETRARVLEIAAKLGYRPNKLAQALRSNKTKVIGVIVGDIANPYFSMLARGIVKATRAQGYSVLLQSTDEDYQREKEAVEVLLAERVDGVLITPTQRGRETIEALKKSGLPFVLMSRHFSDRSSDYVVMDDHRGGFLATEHLLNLGRKRVAMVNGPLHISSARERFEGYKQALEEHGIVGDLSLVLTGALTMEDGYQAGLQLLTTSAPDAIFAFSDFVAFGVLKALREHAVKVPQEVAVVGFDDVMFASCLETPLTTVGGETEMIGYKAAELLIRKLNGEGVTERSQIRLPVRLVVRATA